MVTKCSTSDGYCSDHRAVDVWVDTLTPSNPQIERYLWRDTEWKEYGNTLTDLLAEQDFTVKSSTADSPETIDAAANILSECMARAAELTVPVSKPSPFSKRWWTKELSEQLRSLKTLQNRALKRNSTPAERAAVIPARREYTAAVKRQKRRHWAKWLEEATDRTVWQANKYITQEPGNVTASRTPDLQGPQGMATTNEEKSNVLRDTFFPEAPDANLDDLDDFEYPTPLDSPEITSDEVAKAIEVLSPYKAPGPNAIPNIAIQSTRHIIIPSLTSLFNACLRVGHQPTLWKIFTTVTLRKPHKPDYSIPKAYRPIALEDTIGKVLEAVIARRLSSLAEIHGLLPPNHFGGRPGRTTTDAVLYLVQRIKDAWRGKGVTSVLFLDISQAFPSVSHTRLIHNLRKRQVPENLVTWISSFLTGRTTKLKFDDYTSEPLQASTGIPQGSPMSPILYLFYGADLLEITDDTQRDRFTAGYIDDTMLAATSATIEENVAKLEAMAIKALEWSSTHACKFDITKFQLVHFTRNQRKYQDLPVTVADHQVSPTDTAKYLGIILDRRLRWKEQVEKAMSVGTSTMLAVARLSKSTKGLPQRYAMQLYRSVVQPKVEYGLPVWYEPVRKRPGEKRKKGSVGVARKLGKVQRLAARVITGGFRTTATDVLDYHAGLPPIDIHLNQVVFNAAVRMATLPKHHPLHKAVKRCSNRYPHFHRSPIHELFQAFPEVRELETIDATPLDPTQPSDIITVIASSKEEAIEDAQRYGKEEMCVFTDGSGYKGNIGAAAWTDQGGKERSHQLCLGKSEDHTVFEGEVCGAILGLEIIAATPRITKATILLDNQAAITALKKRPPKSGQHLVKLFHTTMERLKAKRRTLRVRLAWVPGHRGVKGNEKVDGKAKGAAEGNVTPVPHHLRALTNIPRSAAAAKATYKAGVAKEWTTRWRQSKHGKRIAKFDRTPPGRQATRPYKSLPKYASSILTQLRSGHMALNQYLARFNIVDSPNCALCRVPETVDHFLFSCRRFLEERGRLRMALRRLPLTTHTLIGGRGRHGELLEYVKSTRRFPMYVGIE
ncbi:hypothetical protein NLI96_g10952 [Meripilus lineatus]|uniref:Reverse transcriptase n=1 Tax=Meripilus lineatus TaxID=2056292 RepID=A0AAD5UU98_9APHY|nr:hypothetical protein NLI96_g10952 [Physisporinus lineatus]